jgi:hypothetical protein
MCCRKPNARFTGASGLSETLATWRRRNPRDAKDLWQAACCDGDRPRTAETRVGEKRAQSRLCRDVEDGVPYGRKTDPGRGGCLAESPMLASLVKAAAGPLSPIPHPPIHLTSSCQFKPLAPRPAALAADLGLPSSHTGNRPLRPRTISLQRPNRADFGRGGFC